MYLPSMFFGASSFIHLLASNPRVVAVFGLGALITTLLQSPFGTPDVIGTAGYLKQLEHVARLQVAIETQIIEHARSAARALAQSSGSELAKIVEETLRDCGPACSTLETSTVVKDRELLADVLLLHTLNATNQRASVRVKAVSRATESSR